MTGLGEQLADLFKEAVEEYLGERSFRNEVEAAVEDMDFSDQIKYVVRDEMPDVDDKINNALGDWDFSDAIHDVVRDYDWWKEIEDQVNDEIKTVVDQRFDSPEFKALVKSLMLEIISDKVAEIHQRVKNALYWPWRKLRSVYKRD